MVETLKLFNYDLALKKDGINLIAGIDEVGRGPLAGPVVTACVVMDYSTMIDGVFDSKKLSKRQREQLYDEIFKHAKSISICKKDIDVIDDVNILNATKLAMKESYNNLTIKPDLLLIDAVSLNICEKEMPIIRGDATSYAIACASIVAKVYRDRLMQDYSKTYPNYDFENNVGYGTKKHIDAIKTFGVTPIHRLSFLKNIIGAEQCNQIYMERKAK